MEFWRGDLGSHKIRFILISVFMFWLPGPVFAQSQASLNLYDNYTTSYTIPYTSPPDYNDPAAALHVSVSIDGSAPLTYQVDTGSQGMVVPQYLIPGFVQAPLADQQKILYSSSGNYSIGTWATETITFPGSYDADGQEATATVPVLVESKSVTDDGNVTTDCSKQGARCTTLLGIGYGRPDAGWGPDYLPSLINNPLLNITGMANGTVRAGYVITPTGIEAGLTAANAGSGYAYTQLVPKTPAGEDSPNWETLPGSVVVNGSTVQSGGGVLLDTGISYAWADLGSTIAANAVPCGKTSTCAPPGTEVTVYLGATDSVGFSYTVCATGDSTCTANNSTAAPEFMRVNGGEAMNTGIHPFSVFDYMFDAVGGIVGLKEINPGTTGVDFTPGLSVTGALALPDAFSTNLPIYVSNDSTIMPAGAAAFLGGVSGPGMLTVDGPGSFLFAGGADLPAGIAVAAGSAVFAGNTVADLAVAAGAGGTNSGVISGDVTNGGAFVNSGSITGGFVNTGVLINNGNVSGMLSNAGLLSGSGPVGGLAVSAGGIVDPGGSGTVAVNGAVTFAPGSTYIATLGAPGKSRGISAVGAASAGGATLIVMPGHGFKPLLGTAYTVLAAAGGVSGNFTLGSDGAYFGTPASALPFLSLKLTNTGTAEEVTLNRSAVNFASFAQTANEENVAAVADSSGASAPLTAALAGLTGSAAPAAFASLAGEIYPSLQSILLAQSSFVRDAVESRLRQAAEGEPAGDAGIEAAPLASTNATLWEQTYGGWESPQGNADAAPVTSSTGGFMLGGDADAGAWRAGAAAGFGQSSMSANEVSSSATNNNYDFAVYAGRGFASAGPGAWALRLGGAYSWNQVSVQRSVLLPDSQATYKPNYAAQTGQVFSEIAYGISLTPAAFRIEPFAGISYAIVNSDSLSEGTGATALTAQGNSFGRFASTLGTRGSLPVALGKLPLTLSALLGWEHSYGNLTPRTRLAFAGGAAPFTTYGVPLAANALLTGASISGHLGAATISVAYSGEIAPSVINQNALNGTISWRF